jgi:DNA-binding NarL/FixJ family response regulator
MSGVKVVTYITSNVTDDQIKSNTDKIVSELPLVCERVREFQHLFLLLSDSTYHTDYIAIDLDDAYSFRKTNIFELLNTITTLIRFSREETKIIALVGDTTPTELIKEIISFPSVAALVPRIGGSFTYEDCKESWTNILNQNYSIPKKIQEVLHPKRKHSFDGSEINLTPRQKQIFRMIIDRGSSNKIIAKMLNISESTVKLHMSSILKKFKVKNRTQLAVFGKEFDTENKVQSINK